LPARTDLWFAPAWTMLPLASRRCRVRNPVNGVVAELSADQYAVLTACEGCCSLPDHHVAVQRKLDVRVEDRAMIFQWLQEFVARGLFVSLDDLVGRLGSVPHASSASFAGIAIRTCDRPALLARLLRSVAALEARYARAYHYVVLDDSRDAANRAANRQCVAKNERLDCAYYDLTDTSLVEQELRHAFPDAAKELDWLLGPPGPGEATYG